MIELLGIYIDGKEFNDAEKLINAKSSIIDNNKDNLTLLKNVITAHLMMNHPTLATGLFYSLEGSISKILIDDLGVVQNDSSGINYLANGAGIQAPGNISLYNDPDFANKYKTEGNVYQLSGITRKKMAFYFPISNERENPDNNSEAGIYNYYKNKFNLIHPISKDAASIVKLEVSNPGVYAFLKEKPIIFKLFNVYFDYAKYNIRKDAEKNLFSLIDYLKSNPFIKMEIAGHTDNVGTPEYNLNLSLKRAEAIKNFLVKKGIRENRLTARGYGSQYPLVDNSTESNRQKNRRSEFIVLQNSENKGNLAGEAVKRFSVEIRNFNSMQEAYKLNKFFNKRKFKTSVTISRVKNKTVFKVLLGIFPTEDEANKAVNKFTAEFKNYQPKIVRIR